MNQEEPKKSIINLRISAAQDIKAYVYAYYPWMDSSFVNAIINALGEISVDEAISAIEVEAYKRRNESI